MKALIIGGAGFVGHYLIDHLQKDCKWSVSVTKMKHESISNATDISIYDLDILDKQAIFSLFNKIRPDSIIHLAAQSSVSVSWKNPALTVDVNIKGTINLLEAIRELDYKPKVLLIGSGEEYGNVKQEDIPLKETNVLAPGNIYAATKVCQNMMGKIYADAYDMNVIMARPFNHIGCGQSPIFVVSDFCKQVAAIENGVQDPVIKVGNLSAKRDFTDVRDVVKAYSELIMNGKKGEIYNIGNGNAIEIKSILELILSKSKKDIIVKIDPGKFRPVDVPIIEPDIGKLKDICDWEPTITIEQSISDILIEWRNFYKNKGH